jgi:hypothetical protein
MPRFSKIVTKISYAILVIVVVYIVAVADSILPVPMGNSTVVQHEVVSR